MNLPVGSIILWADATIPEGWQICNGTNGTPNLIGCFPRGAASDGELLSSGGAPTHVHGNGSTGSVADHVHSGIGGTTGGAATNNVYGGTAGSAAPDHVHDYSSNLAAGGGHAHAIGNTGAASSLPPYKTVVYIMRMT